MQYSICVSAIIPEDKGKKHAALYYAACFLDFFVFIPVCAALLNEDFLEEDVLDLNRLDGLIDAPEQFDL